MRPLQNFNFFWRAEASLSNYPPGTAISWCHMLHMLQSTEKITRDNLAKWTNTVIPNYAPLQCTGFVLKWSIMIWLLEEVTCHVTFSMHQFSSFRTLTENLKPCINGPSAKSANRGLLWRIYSETRKILLQIAMQTFIFPHLWGEISSLADGLSAKSAEQVQLTSEIQKYPPAVYEVWKHPFLRPQIATELAFL